MGNYVQIRTSIADILSIANGMRTRAEAFTTSMNGAMKKVTDLEADHEVFPPDEFTDGFAPIYHQPVPAGDGHDKPANQAVQDAAKQMGTAMVTLSDHVSDAMWGYSGTDGDNAAGISSSA
jgi:hypothetical protein